MSFFAPILIVVFLLGFSPAGLSRRGLAARECGGRSQLVRIVALVSVNPGQHLPRRYDCCDRAQATKALTGQPTPKIETSFDPSNDRTTVRLTPVQISGEKDKYYSLHFAAAYSYPGRVFQRPETIDFELRSVVKARKLKIDLYVEFVVDGEEIFLSSSRSSIKNAVRGRPWVGERLVFRMPYEMLLKITKAQQFAIKMDAVSFEVGERQMEVLREFVMKSTDVKLNTST